MNRTDRHRRLAHRLGLTLCLLFTVAACADFSTPPPPVTIQPSLSAAGMHAQEEGLPPLGESLSTSSPTNPTQPPPPTGGTATDSADPCRPADPTIIAACLEAPWGLAVLPGGASAVVGERTTGRILLVAPQAAPALVTTIDGLDASGDGGLLGIALSPHFAEDGLLYAYVTTQQDNRIIRIATGDDPKPIFTGIPKGSTHNGGRIAFGADGDLYIATGDAGIAGAGADPATLAGKVLRIDEFGGPAGTAAATPTGTSAPSTDSGSSAAPSTPAATTAVVAHGLVNPTGICLLADGSVGVIDRVGAADVLTTVREGADQATEPPLWSFLSVDGGAVDCAVNETTLAATSLDQQQVTALTLGQNGGFTGQPQKLVKDVYGRLLSIEPGQQGLLWATTSNKDGHGRPKPRDDMVVVIPTSGGGGGDGVD